MYLRKYGTGATVNFPLIKRGVVDFATSSDYTYASGDIKIRKDEGASANATNSPTHEGEGIWSLALTATEMEAARVTITVVDSATKAVEDQCVIIDTYGNASAQHAFDLNTATQSVNVTQFGGSNGTFSSGRPEVNTSHIAGSSVSTSTAQIGVNVVNFGGSAGTFSGGRPEVNATHLAGTAYASADFSSTMKGSVSTAVWDAATASYGSVGTYGALLESGNVGGGNIVAASVTGAVGSVTGSVGGNVTGSVGSVATGGITAASFGTGAITATVIAADAIGASELATDAVAEIAAAVWDLSTTGHTTSGTFGAAMNAAGSAGDPWSTSLPGAYSAGTAGYILGTNLDATVSSRAPSATALSTATWTGTLATNLATTNSTVATNLDAAVSTRLASASYTAPDNASIAAILDDTGTSGVVVAAGSKTGYALTSAYDFAKGTTAMTEAYAANGAAPTPVQALFAIHQYLMQFAITSTSYTVKKLDNSTTAFVVTLDDGTSPTGAERT